MRELKKNYKPKLMSSNNKFDVMYRTTMHFVADMFTSVSMLTNVLGRPVS